VSAPVGNTRIPIDAIIDTGATTSAIRSDIAEQLGLPQIDSQLVATVGGARQQPVVLAHMTLAAHDGSDGPTTLTQLICADQMTDPMLFGMDLMRGGVLTVDFVKNQWNWKIKKFAKK